MNGNCKQWPCTLIQRCIISSWKQLCLFASVFIVIPNSNSWVLSWKCDNQRSLNSAIDHCNWTWVKTLGNLINLNLFIHSLIQPYRLYVSDVHIVIFTSSCNILFSHIHIKRNDSSQLIFWKLPTSYEIKDLIFFVCALIVFLTSNPHCKMTFITSQEKSFWELFDWRDVVNFISSKCIVNRLLWSVVFYDDDLSICSCCGHSFIL